MWTPNMGVCNSVLSEQIMSRHKLTFTYILVVYRLPENKILSKK